MKKEGWLQWFECEPQDLKLDIFQVVLGNLLVYRYNISHRGFSNQGSTSMHVNALMPPASFSKF